MRHFVLISAVILMASGMALAQQQTGRMISFGPNGQYQGYFVPGTGTSRPGIVMIHEWWGLNDQIRQQARSWAACGYNVLAVDLFNKATTDREEAMRMVRNLNQQAATNEMLAAAQYLRTVRNSNGRAGVLGWCFGGGQALILAINDPRLDAAVIYYGQPVTDQERLKKIRAPILGLYGEADQSIPLEKVREFDRALTAAGVPHEIHTYPGAEHAFANPTRSDAYKPAAARDANAKAAAFLARYLKTQPTAQ